MFLFHMTVFLQNSNEITLFAKIKAKEANGTTLRKQKENIFVVFDDLVIKKIKLVAKIG
jgi:hypothetical protein